MTFCALSSFRAAVRGVAVLAALLPACHGGSDTATTTPDASPADGMSLSSPFTLQLVAEKKLAKLLPTKAVDHYEASGITLSDGMLYVASDNTGQIAAIDTSLDKGELGPGGATESQYEAITVSDDNRFFAMVETASVDDPRTEIAELGPDTSLTGKAFTDATFEHANKGFEGVAWLRVGGTEYLLALCENNNCKDDDSPAGEGRAKLMSLVDGVWVTQTTLKVPEPAAFLNYSDLALRDNGDGTFVAAIVSHKSSALWLGRLTTTPWAFNGPSSFYVFPRTAEGVVQYCSVEGITFLGPSVLAAVSDESDGSTPCSAKEESIHIFQMPR